MILVDLSSLFHKCTHGFVAGTLRVLKKNNKEPFVDFEHYRKQHLTLMLGYLCDNLTRFSEFGIGKDVVICLEDNSGRGNWRKMIYPMYKGQRKEVIDSIKTFDFKEAYKNFDIFIDALKESDLFTVLDVDTCEADDIILVLGKKKAQDGEKVMILSPDKDFLQLQENSNVIQYSWTTKKILKVNEQDMDNWLLEHVCLGDAADNIPRVVDFQEFKPGIKELLIEQSYPEDITPWEFSGYYYNPKDYESFGGVFERPALGIKTLHKKIKEYEGLDNWLDSNHVYRKNFYRNKQLVMEEGIPEMLKENIISKFESCYNSRSKNPATRLVEALGLDVKNVPNLVSSQYMREQQLKDFLDWSI